MRGEGWIDARGERWTILAAITRRERLRGLIGRARPGPREGLLLPRCRSIHTLGLRMPIEAVLLDGGLLVLDVVRIEPARVLWPRRGVRHILEVAEGSGLLPGDRFRRSLPRQPTSARAARLSR
jgi:uncharacterized membrane protein (UPF0127 family)